MTEKQKRDAGLLYDANYDPALHAELTACRDKCFEYNQLKPSMEEERTALMRTILGRTGEQFSIHAPFYCDYGYNIQIGERFFMNYGCVILDCAKVTFGDDVFIAPMCGFHTAGHPLDAEQRNKGLEYAYPIKVGSNVWFGANVQVLPGVTIGSNVVIGSGSVVTHDIPDGVVAVGNPCKVLRPITEEDRHRDYTWKGFSHR